MKECLNGFENDICRSKGSWPVKASKNGIIEVVPRAAVCDYPYIVVNTTAINWIHIDVDLKTGWEDPDFHPAFDLEQFERHCLQLPNLIVHSGSSYHLLWRLEASLPLIASPASSTFMSDVRRKIIIALNGDNSCPIRNVACKNPEYPENKTRFIGVHKCHLDKINIDIPLPRKSEKTWNIEYGKGQRNDATFKAALTWWWDGGQNASLDEILSFIESYQERHSDVAPLSRTENTSIASSILRNGHKYPIRADRNYGDMELPEVDYTGMTAEQRLEIITDRKSGGAKYSNQKRSKRTREEVLLAIKSIQRKGNKITAKSIANLSGVSYRTVQRYIKVKRGKVTWKQ